MFLHSIHTLLKQYSGSIQGNASLLTLGTPWVYLGYTLGRVCEIRHKSIKNPSNRKRKIDISTDEHIRNYQNWLIVARASRVTHRRSQEYLLFSIIVSSYSTTILSISCHISTALFFIRSKKDCLAICVSVSFKKFGAFVTLGMTGSV